MIQPTTSVSGATAMDGVMSSIRNSAENFEAGKIKGCLKFWKAITSDKEILGYVNGITVKFIENPTESLLLKEFEFSEDEREVIREEVAKFLQKGIIKEVKHMEDEEDISFVTNVFVRTKLDGSARTILNLKRLNTFIERTHFKMETLKSALKLVKRGCWFANIDLKDAYYSVPVKKRDRKFFRFHFEGKVYEFQCMPQGYCDAPRVFTKITKPLMAVLRSQGFSNSIYIDDILLTADTFEEISSNVKETIQIFDAAGFTVHTKKSVVHGTKNIEFLGFVIDSEDLVVKLSHAKADGIITKTSRFLTKQKVTIQEISETIGTLVASEPGNLYARIFYKRLEIYRNKMLKEAKGNYKTKIAVPSHLLLDLNWWCKNVDKYPRPIAPPKYDKVFSCDASLTGWEVHSVANNTSSGGLWSEE